MTIRGIQKSGISACVKHFAANNQELRRMVSDSIVDERALRELYLTPFEIAVKEGGVGAVMSSYNKVNGSYANENAHLLRDILRREWRFDGVVVTDWAGCNDRVEGVRCGSDLEMPACRYGADDVFRALEEGTLDESLVDESLDRLIDLVLKTQEALKHAPSSFDEEAHHAIARSCAEEGIVLLKNDGTLPLGREKVCFIGDLADRPRYQGAGSSLVNPTRTERFLEEAADYGINFIGYAPGYKRFGGESKKRAEAALGLAQKAETVVFFAGLDEIAEAEGLDRRSMKLPENQRALLSELYKTGKKIVVVLFSGSAVELGCAQQANAIVHACLGGQAGVGAMLNVLSGKVNPSGKLSESYPASYEDCPTAGYFLGRQRTSEYRESIFVGYRYYATAKKEVLYPFGYGLSYTTCSYSGLSVKEDGVRFTVTNTGSRDGAETAQLYISKPDSVLFRPALELKGFCKVFLRAGGSRLVFIPFDEYTFRVFNPKANTWQREGGAYRVLVGASSQDIRLEGTIDIENTLTDPGYDKTVLAPYFSGEVAKVGDDAFSALLQRPLPPAGYSFYQKNRMVIDENCTVDDLRYSRRWIDRLVSGTMRFAHRFLWAIGKKTAANTLTMGVIHQPVRGIAKFGGLTRRKMEALLMMFNGHMLRGIGRFFTREKAPVKRKAGS